MLALEGMMNTRFVIEQPKSPPAAPPSQPAAGGDGGGPSASASPNERAGSPHSLPAWSSSAFPAVDASPAATNPNDPDDPIAIAHRRVQEASQEDGPSPQRLSWRLMPQSRRQRANVREGKT